jgi:hypothetical protein
MLTTPSDSSLRSTQRTSEWIPKNLLFAPILARVTQAGIFHRGLVRGLFGTLNSPRRNSLTLGQAMKAIELLVESTKSGLALLC